MKIIKVKQISVEQVNKLQEQGYLVIISSSDKNSEEVVIKRENNDAIKNLIKLMDNKEVA